MCITFVEIVWASWKIISPCREDLILFLAGSWDREDHLNSVTDWAIWSWALDFWRIITFSPLLPVCSLLGVPYESVVCLIGLHLPMDPPTTTYEISKACSISQLLKLPLCARLCRLLAVHFALINAWVEQVLPDVRPTNLNFLLSEILILQALVTLVALRCF